MIRVLPRDAFNDANLLKCVGQLVLKIEDGEAGFLTYEYDGEPFDIRQNPADGSTTVDNVIFRVKDWQSWLVMCRPLNSREPWPLYCDYNDETYYVFDEDGELTLEFKNLIGASDG